MDSSDITVRATDPTATAIPAPSTILELLPAAPAPQPFDYSGWQPEVAVAARAAAATIRGHMERAVGSMVEAGLCLRAIHDQLPHGQWQAWLEAEFTMSDRMARHLLQVAEAFAGKTEMISVLNPTAAIKLAAAPEAARNAVVERLQAGEKMTVAEIVAATRRPTQPRPLVAKDNPSGFEGNRSPLLAVAPVVAPRANDGMVTVLEHPVTAVSPAMTWSFARDFERQVLSYWREAVAKLAATVDLVAEDVKSTAAQCLAKGRPPTKKWMLQMYQQLTVMTQSCTELAGTRYCVRRSRSASWAGPTFMPEGALDEILDALHELFERCMNGKEPHLPPLTVEQLVAIRDRLIKAGL